jgi:hypothetical protein
MVWGDGTNPRLAAVRVDPGARLPTNSCLFQRSGHDSCRDGYDGGSVGNRARWCLGSSHHCDPILSSERRRMFPIAASIGQRGSAAESRARLMMPAHACPLCNISIYYYPPVLCSDGVSMIEADGEVIYTSIACTVMNSTAACIHPISSHLTLSL